MFVFIVLEVIWNTSLNHNHMSSLLFTGVLSVNHLIIIFYCVVLLNHAMVMIAKQP